MLAEILAADGHEVVQAAGGREALDRLQAGLAADLVLTDLGMPGMTGWDVAEAVKARWPELRVGLITCWGDRPDESRPETRRADFVLAKPVTQQKLREAIGRGAERPGA